MNNYAECPRCQDTRQLYPYRDGTCLICVECGYIKEKALKEKEEYKQISFQQNQK